MTISKKKGIIVKAYFAAAKYAFLIQRFAPAFQDIFKTIQP